MASTRLQGVIRHIGLTVAARGAAGVPDAQLLERFVGRRDEAAFELLVWRHGKMVFGTCRRLLRDAHEAEDAFQACFLALARRAGSIGRGASVGGWLHKVAFRLALGVKARRGSAPPANNRWTTGRPRRRRRTRPRRRRGARCGASWTRR